MVWTHWPPANFTAFTNTQYWLKEINNIRAMARTESTEKASELKKKLSFSISGNKNFKKH